MKTTSLIMVLLAATLVGCASNKKSAIPLEHFERAKQMDLEHREREKIDKMKREAKQKDYYVFTRRQKNLPFTYIYDTRSRWPEETYPLGRKLPVLFFHPLSGKGTVYGIENYRWDPVKVGITEKPSVSSSYVEIVFEPTISTNGYQRIFVCEIPGTAYTGHRAYSAKMWPILRAIASCWRDGQWHKDLFHSELKKQELILQEQIDRYKESQAQSSSSY